MGKIASFLVVLAALSCSHLDRLTNPEPDPDTSPATEPVAARDTIRVELPEREPVVPTPQEARDALADRGIPYSQASFIEAAAQGDLDVVRLFVQAGLSVDVQPYTARSVLVSTRANPTSLGHLQKAFYPEEGEQDNDTALMKAAGNGHLEVVKLLVDAGADLLLRNQQGQTAAEFAAAGGHLKVLQYMRDAKKACTPIGVYGGFDPVFYKYSEHPPETPMMWAAYNGHMHVVQWLKEECRDSAYPWYNMGWAVLGGHRDIAEYFLRTFEDWTDKSHAVYAKGISLVLAAHTGDEGMVRWLLDEGADIHYRENDWIRLTTPEGPQYFQGIGNTAMHIAISRGHGGLLRILLEHWMLTQGADGRDPYGVTALMLAVAGGDEDMATTLIENGAPVNARTDVGTTALMYAAAVCGQASMVQFLLDRGADASVENAHGWTALALAQEFGHDEVVAILE